MKKKFTNLLHYLPSLNIKWLVLLLIGITISNRTHAVEKQTQEAGLVSNISATSGRSYTLGALAVGVQHYTDRTYKITSVPSTLGGASLIRTANDDKKSTGSSLLSFSLSEQATVYVAYDPRSTALPAWLSGWQKLTDRIGVDDSQISHMELYSKSFPAGSVSLGGNLQSPAAGAQTNYFIVARAAEAPATATLISNISASSGRGYVLSDLAVGVQHYTDRTYKVTSVPSSLGGASLIRTANDDKKSTVSTLLSFSLSEQATVYVAYDPRSTALPGWLSGWQKLTDRIGVDDSQIGHMELYSKSFPAGSVSLGGNLQSPAAGAQNNYFVVAKAAQAGQYTLSVSTTGSGTVTKSPNQASYASGASVSLTATAASGYVFSGWSGDATGTANPLSVTMSSNKAITASFTQSQPSGGLISNVSASSGRSYVLSDLSVGVQHYTDRTYKITSVPSSLGGASLIRTANDDKKSTGSTLLSFSLSEQATVYVAYDPRSTALPAWLSGWQKLTDRIGVDDSQIGHMELYSKSFPAGSVSLGGNLQSPAAGAQNNYFVVAKAAQAGQYTLSVSTTGSGTVSKSPNQASYASGASVSLTATAASGYVFSGWSGDATGTANPLSVTMSSNKAITASFTQSQPSTGLVSNITATSGRSYALGDLAVGVPFYTDRTYTVTSVPSSLGGASLIRTANDDKKSTGSSLLSFSLSEQATVYVAYDPRSTALPGWLSGWQKLTDRIGVDDSQIGHMELYSKTFPAGSVSLGGNLQSPAAGAQNNYFVMAKAFTGEDNIAPTVAVQLNGILQSPGVYSNEVTVSVQASDEGGSGVASVQYSLNNGAYTTYSAPFKIISEGSYTIRARATDGSGNQTTTDATSFSVVKSSQSNASMVLESAEKFPANDQLTFSLIQNPWRRQNDDGTYTPYNDNHNKVRLRIHNKGTGSLHISNLSISHTSLWKIAQLNGAEYDAGTALPISISSKGYADVLVEFIAKDLATRAKVVEGALTISSNDDLTPTKEVKLRGLWQRYGEGNSEPFAQEIIDAFGFKTRTGFASSDGASDGTYIMPNSDEIESSYFLRVDPSQPVHVVQMAAYHGCCSDTETIQWYAKGSTSTTTIVTHNPLDGQSLLPRKYGSSTQLAQGEFKPTTAFGIKVQRSYSDRTKNYLGGIGLRIWKAVDTNGNIIPNAYIIGMDYLTSPYVNYDYQDNIYYVTNVKPESGPSHTSELAATPSAVDFGAVLAGSSKSLTVNLKNLGKAYDSGSDPAIQISSIEVVGPNSSEFTGPALSTTLATQASTNITVSFRPSSLGIKNAALLVHYNNAASPLRIPLYGIANNSSTTISAVKRIKGAADASRTIAGNVWEADINYRKGSIKLDKQVVAGPIASTEDDVLYQTYLSAATDLAETRYEIPISNGSYMVRMHFVENYFSAEGARVFNINIENVLRLNGFDIHREVGYRATLVKDFEVNVTDGVLNLKFNPTANRVAIAGVEIFRATATNTLASSSNVENAASLSESNELTLRVYPNPATGGQVFMEAANFGRQEAVTLTVHDVLGRVVASVDAVTDQQGYAHAEVPVQLKRGMYIIRARAAGGEAQAKLLVQ